MLIKILKGVMLGIPAALISYTSIVWWMEFGVREVYPYAGTLMAILLWACVYNIVIEKED